MENVYTVTRHHDYYMEYFNFVDGDVSNDPGYWTTHFNSECLTTYLSDAEKIFDKFRNDKNDIRLNTYNLEFVETKLS